MSPSVASFRSERYASVDVLSTSALPCAPTLPEIEPETLPREKPGHEDPSPSEPKPSPFAPPPWVKPGEEPAPKA